MPMMPPRLDDRSFDDLVAELLARIPAHTPEWTNPRVGDPGRTLIELFAWLGDTLLYRANLIPERQRLVFLKLLGMQLRPALPARGLIALTLDPKAPATAVSIRAGARLPGPPAFETLDEVTVLPVEGRVYAKQLLDESTDASMTTVVADLTELYRTHNPKATGTPKAYVTTEVFPDGAPLRDGFDMISETADRALWLALMAPSADLVEAARSSLAAGNDGRPFTLSIGIAPTNAPIDAFEQLPRQRALQTSFELLTGEQIDGRYVFDALDVVRDSTGGMIRDGVVSLALVANHVGVPSNDAARHWAAGMGELPPRIDAPDDAARVVAWLRVRVLEPLEQLRLSWIGVHAVEIEQSRSYRDLVVGHFDARGDRSVQLPATSIDATSLQLEIRDDDGAYLAWTQVNDLAAHGRDDRVYTLDAEAGIVRFGDGLRGASPSSGARIRVARMKAGGGPEGNLPAATLTDIRGEDPQGGSIQVALKVHQRLPTRGGVAAETLAQAEARIQSELRHSNRAVTRSDFASLAATVPGLRVGRVELLPRFKPHQRRQDVPGVVSVMVIPAVSRPDFRPPAPRPDRVFVETVHAWLDERRLLGTELYVIAPEYVPLAISVGVDLRSGHPIEQTLAAVRLAVRLFFWPLAPGGPGGSGWPLGGRVVAPQAEVAVARVRGVEALRGLRLFRRQGASWERAPTEQTLEPWQLPELLQVVVVAGADAPDTLHGMSDPSLAGVGAGGAGGDVLPIPVVPEVC